MSMLKEVTAPAYWQLSGQTFDVPLEYPWQIIKMNPRPTLPKTGY